MPIRAPVWNAGRRPDEVHPDNPSPLDLDDVETGNLTVPRALLQRAAEPGEDLYLLVFEQDSSRIFRLPASGEVTIGRTEAAGLVLRDHLVSRNHAAITIEAGEVKLRDLGSQNGTFVNGEQLTAPRTLLTGDTIAICTVTLVFHGLARARHHRALLTFDDLRERIEAELDRALRYQRELAVLVLFGRDGFGALEALPEQLSSALRRIDLVGWAGSDQLAFLLPESGASAASVVGQRLLKKLAASGRPLQAGIATYPRDGADVDSLVAGARSAALGARNGELAPIRQSYKTLEFGGQKVIVADASMTRLYGLVERLAAADLPVMVVGETGSGKELAASALHHWSPRFGKPLVSLNCAALQESLLESELFGYEKGAFSGATGSKPGLIEAADGGTLFLDEVGELTPLVQAKLLRVLETRRLTRLGDTRERQINVRFVCATNRDLEREVKAGRFRQDLYFRLNGAKLCLPPLRDRRLEIPILSETFLTQARERLGKPALAFAPPAMALLCAYRWPGNVRELKNLMDYLAATVAEPVVETWHLMDRLSDDELPELAPGDDVTSAGFLPIDEEIRNLERSRMWSALIATGGNKTRAASMIGMPLRTFLTKLKKYGAPDGSTAEE